VTRQPLHRASENRTLYGEIYKSLWVWVTLKRVWFGGSCVKKDLRTFAADTTSELNVFWHDCHTLGVDSTQVCIFEKTDKVGLRGFLKGQDGGSLETKIGLEILGNLTDKTLEGQLADEKVSGLLVTTNLTESNGSGTVTMGLLDTSGSGGRLSGCLGGELLSRSLSSGRLTSGLMITNKTLVSYMIDNMELV
jgi:hypothetical protein